MKELSYHMFYAATTQIDSVHNLNLKPWKMFHFNSSTRKMALFSEFPKTREALFTCF